MYASPVHAAVVRLVDGRETVHFYDMAGAVDLVKSRSE